MQETLRKDLKRTGFWVLAILLLIALVSALSCSRRVTRTGGSSEPSAPHAGDVQVPYEPHEPPTFPVTATSPVGTLRPIYFDFDRYDIRPDQVEALDDAALSLRRASPPTVVLEGHADERGTIEYNLALGQRRADTVRRQLLRLGVLGNIQAVSYGEERPADGDHDETAWAKNRRVEFLIP